MKLSAIPRKDFIKLVKQLNYDLNKTTKFLLLQGVETTYKHVLDKYARYLNSIIDDDYAGKGSSLLEINGDGNIYSKKVELSD